MPPMNQRTPKLFAVSLVVAGTVLVACHRPSGSDLQPEVDRLSSELADTQGKLLAAVKSAEAQKQEVATAIAAIEASKREATLKDKLIQQKEAEVAEAKTAISAVKNTDALAYSEASAQVSKGSTSNALERYQKFILDYPDSPLVADANRAIADLTPQVAKDAQYRTSLIDPRRADRDLIKRFGDGIVTVQELVPLLRRRSQAEVIQLLGRPSRTYRNGTELGYEDKVIDTTTGNKSTLVISFEADRVTALRSGYQGREVKP